MSGLNRLLAAAIMLAAILIVAGCKAAEEPPADSGGESTSFSFRFNSHAPLGGSATGTSLPLGLVEISGELLVVPDGMDPSKGKIYKMSLLVDEGAAQITTELYLAFPVGAYDIYFLLNTPDLQHAGIEVNHLILSGGVNTITITLNPVLGGPVASVLDLATLSAFSVHYDADVLAGYAYPRVGLAVDGAPEQVFDVVPNPDDPVITLFLAAGTHTVSVRFFDGAIVKSVPADGEPVEPAPPGETPPEIPLVPLTAEATYSFSESSAGSTVGTGSFTFTVPNDVINEALPSGGGDALGNLKAVASIVGPENALVEANLLQAGPGVTVLEPVTDPSTGAVLHYTGGLVIDNFVPGPITWQLSFVDVDTGEEFAYCAQTVDTSNTPTPGSGSFVCNLKLLVRSQASFAPVGTVQVTVTDPSGLVPGALVLLDGEVLGITGGGTPGEELGTLLAFLEPGEYSLQVVEQILDPFGSGTFVSRSSEPQTINVVGSTDGTLVLAVAVTLPPFPFGAPQVTGISPDDGADDVPVDTTIVVAYSRKMDTLSAQLGFHINPDVSGTFTWSADDTVMTFQPGAMLAYQTDYKITIDASSQDVSGTQLKSGRVFHFTTGLQPDLVHPHVVGVTPGPGATNVDVASIVTVNFSEAMNTGTVEGNLHLEPPTPGTYSWSGNGTVVTFTPDSGLAYETDYTIVLDTSATDSAGLSLTAGLASPFSTGVEPDLVEPTVVSIVPGELEPPMPVDTPVTVTFSEGMDPGESQAAFSIWPETPGNKSWSGDNKVMTFTPAQHLAYNKQYRVTVTRNAMDAAGNALAAEASVNFRTVLPPPAASYIEVEAARNLRPRKFDDGYVDITEPMTVRIPGLADVSIVNDELTGEPIGDPDRFLFVLTLGREKCMYLGGKWDRHVGGVAEDFFEHAFKAPVCEHHRAGDVITIQPRPEGSTVLHGGDHNGDHNGDGQYLHRHAEIKARVVTGNPHFEQTRVRVRIEVIQP